MTTLVDTTGAELVNTLTTERRNIGGVTSGIVLTLLIVVDEEREAEAFKAAARATSDHPARILVVVRKDHENVTSRLDAEVCVADRIGSVESVIMRMSGPLAAHAESVVLPLLAPDVPVVTWWHGAPPDRTTGDPLGALADRRVTNCRLASDPLGALRQRAVDYTPGDTDISWTRTTPWRTLLAGTFDTVTIGARSARIATAKDNPTGALLSGWLTHRLGIQPEIVHHEGERVYDVVITLTNNTDVRITREGESTGIVYRPGLPPRHVPLAQRTLGARIADELRHLDPDQPYEAALKAWAGQ